MWLRRWIWLWFLRLRLRLLLRILLLRQCCTQHDDLHLQIADQLPHLVFNQLSYVFHFQIPIIGMLKPDAGSK